MATWADIQKANKMINPIPIKGKEYAEVNQRIKAFRMIYPEGFIITDMISNTEGICIFRAEVGFYNDAGDKVVLGTGTAYEKEGSTFINATSFIENAETSAIGRAIASGCAIGIDTSVASADEVQNAIENQKARTATPKQLEVLSKAYKGDNLKKLLETQNIEKLEDISIEKASELIEKLNTLKCTPMKGGK